MNPSTLECSTCGREFETDSYELDICASCAVIERREAALNAEIETEDD